VHSFSLPVTVLDHGLADVARQQCLDGDTNPSIFANRQRQWAAISSDYQTAIFLLDLGYASELVQEVAGSDSLRFYVSRHTWELSGPVPTDFVQEVGHLLRRQPLADTTQQPHQHRDVRSGEQRLELGLERV
jgi:hypothetical protein